MIAPALLQAATALVLQPGQTAIVQPQPDGTLLVVARDGAAAAPHDDQVRMSLRVERGQTFLQIDHHRARMLEYSAMLTRDGAGAERTSVCTVPPGVPSIEHWPYPIAALALSAVRDADGVDAADVTCQ